MRIKGNKSIIVVIAAFWLAFSGIVVHSETEIERLIEDAPGASEYPDATGLYLKSVITLTLQKDGTIIEEVYRADKILNQKGRGEFSDLRITYDKEREEVILEEARTFKEDKTVIEVDEGNINDVTPPYLMNAAIYANVADRVLSFPAAEPGVVLETKYKKILEPEKNKILSGSILLQKYEPLLSRTVNIRVPEEMEIFCRCVDFNGTVAPLDDKGKNGIKVSVTGQDQIKTEEYMPGLKEIAPRIIFSTAESWDEVIREFKEPFEDAVEVKGAIKEKAEELIGDASGAEEKVQKIFLFLTKKVRNVYLPFGLVGHHPHKAGEILENRYGDGTDKAVLLTSLLRAAGIEAQPVLVEQERIPVIKEIPALDQFNKVIVRAALKEDEYLFLDPLSDYEPYPYFRKGSKSEGLLISEEGYEFVSVEFPEDVESRAENLIRVELDDNGNVVEGRISSELFGYFDAISRMELRDKTGQEADMFFDEALSALVTDSEEIEHSYTDASDPLTQMNVSQSFTARHFGILQGDIMTIELPEFPYGFSRLLEAPRLEKRTYPFRIMTECEVSTTYEIVIPTDQRVLFQPPEIDFDPEYGEFTQSSEFDPENDLITLRRTFKYDERTIMPEQYDEFKEQIDRFGKLRNNIIMLKKEEQEE